MADLRIGESSTHKIPAQILHFRCVKAATLRKLVACQFIKS